MCVGTVFRTAEYSTSRCTCQQEKEEREITDFGREVKKKLIDIGKTQRWLAIEISTRTELKPDDRYLNKVLSGKRNSPQIKKAVKEILGIGS